jgi:curli biogenesis system outer membrane secretion channel CsgG
MTLAIAAIVAAAALTTVAFTVPQQVMAYRHHHHHNNNHKSIKVDQQVNQENQCTGQSLDMKEWILTTPQSGALCINEGSNDATINH